ncbi:MAG: DNA starvation/stationary phase protection protein [Aerococcaceae bacterium]|nr:DNA starvation/stationary phase protection protein [Aerococcaceae bacterium]
MNKFDLLNELTANLGVLYIKLHQHHFYVTGPCFVEYHEYFEELYNEVHGHLDEVAERNIMMGGQPVSTLGEFLQLATIQEAPYTAKKSWKEMLAETLADFQTIVSILEKGIGADFVDEVTEDVLIGMKAYYDKQMWMISATLA